MGIFNAFNKINNEISETYSEARGYLQEVNTFSANVNRTIGQAEDLLTGNTILNRLPGNVGETVRNVQSTVSRVSGFLNLGGSTSGDIGSSIRMTQNASQGVQFGANPITRSVAQARVLQQSGSDVVPDWRVSISVPPAIMMGDVLAPLNADGAYARMIFPFNPSIMIGHAANYSQIHPTHTNYPYQAYENSQVNEYTIIGEFVNETQSDARYWIACLHFLRTVTKMFYGNDSNFTGSPPPVCRLNGYGPHVLNNVPVVITNFSMDMPNDVDYIECVVDGKPNFVPTQVTVTVSCVPNYARRTQARFSLQDFASGKYAGGAEGFV